MLSLLLNPKDADTIFLNFYQTTLRYSSEYCTLQHQKGVFKSVHSIFSKGAGSAGFLTHPSTQLGFVTSLMIRRYKATCMPSLTVHVFHFDNLPARSEEILTNTRLEGPWEQKRRTSLRTQGDKYHATAKRYVPCIYSDKFLRKDSNKSLRNTTNRLSDNIKRR